VRAETAGCRVAVHVCADAPHTAHRTHAGARAVSRVLWALALRHPCATCARPFAISPLCFPCLHPPIGGSAVLHPPSKIQPTAHPSAPVARSTGPTPTRVIRSLWRPTVNQTTIGPCVPAALFYGSVLAIATIHSRMHARTVSERSGRAVPTPRIDQNTASTTLRPFR
jgi:hypothetical protein